MIQIDKRECMIELKMIVRLRMKSAGAKKNKNIFSNAENTMQKNSRVISISETKQILLERRLHVSPTKKEKTW